MSALRLLVAGAGTGKTHSLVEEILAAARARGAAFDLRRVLAVTFTEAAAAELRLRIKGEMLRQGLAEQARQADTAPIMTFHAFCLRLLAEQAFERGASPEPVTLDEQAARFLMRHSIEAALQEQPRLEEEWEFLLDSMYEFDFFTRRTAEQQVLDHVGHLIEAARSLRKPPETFPEMAERAVAALVLPPPEEGLEEALRQACSRFAQVWGRWRPDSRAARERHDKVLRAHALLQAGRALPWRDWRALAALEAPGRDNPYNQALRAVQEVAGRLRCHPGYQQDLHRTIRALGRLARAACDHYRGLKQAGGLVDYTDMLEQALDLLESRPDVRQSLADSLDLLLVDEFQDTSPLQFALVELLREAGVPAVYVGDLKQAIYGFRDADSRLLEVLLESHPARHLAVNRRSRQEIVDFINALFTPAFGEAYLPLEHGGTWAPGDLAPVEVLQVVRAPDDPRPASFQGQIEALAVRLKELLARGPRVWDRTQGCHRPLRGGDVAVLCRNGYQCRQVAAALSRQGLAVSLDEGNLLDQPPVQAVLALYRWCLVPEDTVAAATLLAGELYQVSLEEIQRLAPCLGRPWEDPAQAGPQVRRALDDWRALRDVVRHLPPSRGLAECLQRTGALHAWPAGRPRADLVGLMELAHRFESLDLPTLQALDVPLRTPAGFLCYLEALSLDPPGRPPLEAVAEDAVQVLTMHSSKGLEWPLVVLACLHSEWPGDLTRHSRILALRPERMDEGFFERSWVRLVPRLHCPLLAQELGREFLERDRSEALRLAYVAFTRAREGLLLLWYPREDSYHQLLRLEIEHRDGRPLVAGQPVALTRRTPPDKDGAEEEDDPGGLGPPDPPRPPLEAGLETALRGGPLPADLAALAGEPPAAGPRAEALVGRLDAACLGDLADCPAQFELVHRLGQPWRGTSRRSSPPAPRQRLGPALAGGGELGAALRGQVVHAVLEAGARGAARFGLPAHHPLVQAALEARGRLESHLAGRVEREFPLLLRLGDSLVTGVADLAVEGEEGWWVIDHKTNEVEEARLDDLAAHYTPQLDAYSLALARATGRPVARRSLHFPLLGLLVDLPAFDPTRAERELARLVAVAAGGRFGRNPERDCDLCPYQSGCSQGPGPGTPA